MRCCAAPRPGREMRIVGVARNHVPVQVRHHVAQAGDVDLVRLHHLAQRRFDLPHASIMRSARSRARSVISFTWSFQITRQKPGYRASSTSTTRNLSSR